MPPLMFHHFSGHLPRTRKLCKFWKMMDQNFQTKPITPAKKNSRNLFGQNCLPTDTTKTLSLLSKLSNWLLSLSTIFTNAWYLQLYVSHCQDNSYGRTKKRDRLWCSFLLCASMSFLFRIVIPHSLHFKLCAVCLCRFKLLAFAS